MDVQAPVANPVAFKPGFEVPEESEAQTAQELNAALLKIADITHADGCGGLRSVHAKSHGLLHGELQVLEVPAVYAQGLFARPATYPVKLRLSTSPGDILNDKISTPRGFALKVLGVPGARMDGPPGATTQDFLLVNSPAFMTPTVKKFVGSLKRLASTTDKAPRFKQALSAVLRGSETLVESLGGSSGMLKGMGGHPLTHILGETFFTQVPFLYGPWMAKFQVAPTSPALRALADAVVDMDGDPDALRTAVAQHFDGKDAEWELRVQLCTDLATMPIEDSTVEWSQRESPFVAVARITAPQQLSWSDALSVEFDDGLSFNPWHGLAAHRPLGSVNRARRPAYDASVGARSPRGRCPVHEP